ncbi:MAG: response regulator [Chloroflexi bacterium]|nr:response regulator [Chloroflexota bacterium]
MADVTQPSPPRKSRILIADDEPSTIDVIRQFLELEGYQVVQAVDGEQALEQVRNADPDLMLLDVMMPRMDGYEVCRRLKADTTTVFLPVVMITALRDTGEKIKGVEAGADDFLTKPFNHLELVTRVKSLLRVKHLHDQLEEYNRVLEQRVALRTSQLQDALQELRELDRLKSEFISRVSHELRTPLLHVKGYVGLLVDEALGPLTPDQSKGLETATKAVEQLERLVEDIVDLGSAQVGRLNVQAVSIPEVARATVVSLERATARQGVRIITRVPDSLPPVRADRTALSRCLWHLLDNAIKFSPPQGRVELKADVAPDGDHIRLSVRDQGIGIPKDEADKIFDVFYQVDGSSTRRYGGTGVGLALVKLLLEAHGSTIHAESGEGQGSTFYFDLTVAK